MALTDMMLAVLEDSGLLALCKVASPWLALDERQLIFVVATPVFVAVTLWEYLTLLGLNPVWIGVAYALSLVYQFFIHTTLIGKLPGWIELVFNTPSHHRVHHGRNPGYIDRNYGGTLIVWDRLFGTFVDENAQDPPEFGITRPIRSNNLIVLWTHEYVDLFRDMAQPGGLLSRLTHLWKPPEWQRPATVKNNKETGRDTERTSPDAERW